MKLYAYFIWLFIIACPALALAQNDCPDAIMVCGVADFIDLEAEGPGQIYEISPANACSSGENNTIWLKILIKDGGTLGFVISPTDLTDLEVDFDFWMFGPDVACNSLGTAIRCSTTNPGAALLNYNTTGMNATETDVSEGPGADGNAFIQWITVQTGEVYYLIVDRPHGNGNFSIAWTGTATFHNIPTFLNPDNLPLDLTECDDDGVHDGLHTFDLTVHEPMFIGPQTFVDITYHTSQNDVTTGDNPIASPENYTNTENPQTIYARMTNTVTGCFDTETFTLTVLAQPIAGQPQPLVLCDTNGNGYEVFNLSLNTAAVVNGQTGCTVTYHTSMPHAVAGTNPIGPQYQNQVQFTQTIYARLESTSGCFDVKPFTITARRPQLQNPGNININLTDCDDYGADDWSTLFDLTTHQDMFAGNQQNVTFTYHTNSADVLTGNSAIASPEAYANTANPQTVYVRIYDTVLDCSNFISFTLEVINPVQAGNPPNTILCDTDSNGTEVAILSQNDTAIKNGNTTAAVTYYTSLANAQNEVSPITTFTATYTAQTIWARLENTQGCYGHDITSFSVVAAAMPVFNNPQNINLNLKKCDDDGINDNAVAFNLTTHQPMFVGSQTGLQVTYHTTLQAAQTGNPVIGTPAAYYNTSPLQTIYIRIRNASGCYIIHTFTIELDEPLHPGNPVNLVLCDDNQDGYNVFDLSQNTTLIMSTSIDASVTYHASLANAQNGVNPLPLLYPNQTPYLQNIWARLQSNVGCQGYFIKVFTLKVNTLPQFLNPVPQTDINLTDCDDYGPDDASTLFDLTTYQAMFTGSQANTVFTYHTNPTDAGVGSNPITTPQAYANIANPQTIYIRARNTVTGCHNVMPFTITVINPVEAAAPIAVYLCDTDANGSEVVNLSQYNTQIQNGNTTAAVTYYISEADAQNGTGTGAITTYQATYTPATLWVRVQNTQGCHGHDIASFVIAAVPLPAFNNPLSIDINLLKCDDDGIYNNATTFNLTQHQAMFIGSQAGMQVSYHTTLQDAQDGTAAIGNPLAYTNTSVLQTLYIRMENAQGCFATYSFTIAIDNPLFPGEPADMVLCDYSNTGFEQFDLTLNDALIINGTPNATVSYYFSAADAQTGTNPLALPYQNQWGYVQQIIYARLEGTTGCPGFNIRAFTIKVIRLPKFNNPQNIVLNLQKCDDDTIDDQSTAFDLTMHTTMFLAAQTDMQVSYHTDPAEAALGTNAIATPGAFANTSNPQTIYVRMYSNVTGCHNIMPFTIEVINPFEAGDPYDFVQCDFFGNGHQLFNFSSNTIAIQNGQPNTQVTYYYSQQDAIDGIDPIIDNASINLQPYATQTIWARIESTGACFGYDITSFTLDVLPMPVMDYTISIHDFTYQNNTITVNIANMADFEFSIDGQTYTDNNVFINLEAGIYTVYIRAKNNCKLVTEEIAILNHPKYFTPNGDGANDLWNVYFVHFYPNARVNIFDRYGKLVNSYYGKDSGWDGTYNGRNLPATDYWFVLEMEGGRKVRGHFSLLR